MQVFVRKPSIDLYPGVRVDKDTVLEYKNENVEQRLEGLVFRSKTKVRYRADRRVPVPYSTDPRSCS